MLLQRFLRQHIPQLRATTQPHTPVIHTINTIERLGRHIHCFSSIPAQNARAIHRIIQPLERQDHFIVERVDESLVGNVSCFGEDFDVGVDVQDGGLRGGEGVWVDVCYGDAGATCAGEMLGYGCADACDL